MEPVPSEEARVELFDVEAYASAYVGRTKIERLLFIADKSPPLELECLRLAVDELKKGRDTTKYWKVVERVNGRLGRAYLPDTEWKERVDRADQGRLDHLEAELAQYKNTSVKESTRIAQFDLGDFLFEKGDLQEALKMYIKSRDYCVSAKHHVSMCLKVIRVALEMRSFVHVANYVTKAEQTPAAQEGNTGAMLACASGLCQLDSKKYKLAAKKFTEVSSDLGSSYSEAISPQDVAIYGGLTAMATLSRAELRKSAIDSVSFREFLELVPEMREILAEFYGSKYASCLARLDRLKPQLLLDLHLAPHVPALYKAVRSRALVQFAAPFISVNLSSMAAAFNTDVAGIESELAALIKSGDVTARIDSHSKVLYARRTDPRADTFQRALKISEEYVRDMKLMLLRASIMKHDLIQKGPPSQGRGPRGGGGGGGGAGGIVMEQFMNDRLL